MRLILDTNVVLSGLLWRGTPYRLLEAIRQQPRLQIYSSAALLEELADVLSRPSPSKRLALIGKSVREVLADFIDAVELIEPIDIPRVVLTDPDDDQVIAAAWRHTLIVSSQAIPTCSSSKVSKASTS